MTISYGFVGMETIPSGFRGTVSTLDLMRRMTRLGALDEQVRRLATEIVRNLPSKDYLSEAQALLTFIQKNVRYVRDPWIPDGAERVQHPVVTLFEERCGDCDDMSVALNALHGSIGGGYGWRTIGTDPYRPNDFSHVYSLLFIEQPGHGGAWVPADPIFPGRPLGWEAPLIEPGRVGPQPGHAAARKNWMA